MTLMLPPPVRSSELTANRAYVDVSAASFCIDPTADVIEMDRSTTTLRFHSSRQSSRDQVASVGSNLHQVHIARNINHELAG